jgi:hypothetical protein
MNFKTASSGRFFMWAAATTLLLDIIALDGTTTYQKKRQSALGY